MEFVKAICLAIPDSRELRVFLEDIGRRDVWERAVPLDATYRIAAASIMAMAQAEGWLDELVTRFRAENAAFADIELRVDNLGSSDVVAPVVEEALGAYFEGREHRDRSLEVARARASQREFALVVSHLEAEIRALTNVRNQQQTKLDKVEDRLARGGGWAGVSELMHVYRSSVEFSEIRIRELRDRVQERLEWIRDSEHKVQTLEEAAIPL